MHRLLYKWSQARGSLRRVARIRLLDTSDGGKSRSGFSLDPPHNAARNLTSRHDLNNLTPVSGVRSSYFSDPLTNFIQLTTLLTNVRPSTSLSAVTRQRYPYSRIVPSFRYRPLSYIPCILIYSLYPSIVQCRDMGLFAALFTYCTAQGTTGKGSNRGVKKLLIT